MQALIDEKVRLLGEGNAPRVLDLFSGCGGIFLGFQRAGAVSVGGADSDPFAARSYATNFHRNLTGSAFEAHAAPHDLAKEPAFELLQSWGYDRPAEAVDIIVGGPPCPAFARIGRAKLREIHRHPEAFRHDPRVTLYEPYLQYVEALAPVALLMENVPDILNHAGRNLGEDICDALESLDYDCSYTLLNAVHYGVPQMRERFFLMAIHKSLAAKIAFPPPTHHAELPVGYEGARRVALKALRAGSLFEVSDYYVDTPGPSGRTTRAVTVGEAIADLPAITAHLRGEDKRGARRFDKTVAYRRRIKPSRFASMMRTWPGFACREGISDHVTRCLGPRDHRIFRKMKPGNQYPEAYEIAEGSFADALAEHERRRARAGISSLPRPRREDYVPPYDPGKFPNKWRKLERDKPSRTLMAHLSKDTYSHIHYSSRQARVISVREAARLQSFPDGFKFEGTMNPAFRQIGNSVPPLLAYALATSLLASLKEAVSKAGSDEQERRLSGRLSAITTCA
jgi:DNA (cytosine-5)-methyltransferase 1